jgi:hypothetical protein
MTQREREGGLTVKIEVNAFLIGSSFGAGEVTRHRYTGPVTLRGNRDISKLSTNLNDHPVCARLNRCCEQQLNTAMNRSLISDFIRPSINGIASQS